MASRFLPRLRFHRETAMDFALRLRPDSAILQAVPGRAKIVDLVRRWTDSPWRAIGIAIKSASDPERIFPSESSWPNARAEFVVTIFKISSGKTSGNSF